jgi:hypothetical protein
MLMESKKTLVLVLTDPVYSTTQAVVVAATTSPVVVPDQYSVCQAVADPLAHRKRASGVDCSGPAAGLLV